MNPEFIQNFLKVSAEIEESGKNISWPIPEFANKNNGDFGLLPEDASIGAWQVPLTTAQFLRFLVLTTKAKTILELGSSIGFSTIWLALGAVENVGHVYATEFFPEKAVIAKSNFMKAGVSDAVTLFEKDIMVVLNEWDANQKIDFIFMDADKQRYDQYLEKLVPLMSDNALIVVDNAGDFAHHLDSFMEKCVSIPGITTHFLNIDAGLMLILKNQSAKLFGL